MPRGTTRWRCGADPALNERSRHYKEAYRASKKAMLGPNCEVCGTPENLRWDHDHSTGRFRGTLCNTCNLGLGSFHDNPTHLRAAALYLERLGTQ
jgi:hypothetical protein